MTGVYFSGTGNTKHSILRLVEGLDGKAKIYALENADTVGRIEAEDMVVFAYPVYYSDMPKIVRDFICKNSQIWRGKKVFILCTMGLFSGDGAGCSARLFKKYGATVLGGLHLKMPDCIGDVKLLKKSEEQNRKIIKEADKKIDKTVKLIRNHRYPKEGLNLFYRLAGFFGQRLYFGNKTKRYFTQTKVDHAKCVQCGICIKVCPMKNIGLDDNGVLFYGRCTMCYRCFANCQKQAITLIGKEVFEQYKYENYAKAQ